MFPIVSGTSWTAPLPPRSALFVVSAALLLLLCQHNCCSWMNCNGDCKNNNNTHCSSSLLYLSPLFLSLSLCLPTVVKWMFVNERTHGGSVSASALFPFPFLLPFLFILIPMHSRGRLWSQWSLPGTSPYAAHSVRRAARQLPLTAVTTKAAQQLERGHRPSGYGYDDDAPLMASSCLSGVANLARN